jgi:hypothetical protein
MVNNFDQNDNDAAIAHGFAAAGFTLFGLGLLGSTKTLASVQILGLVKFGAFVPYTWAALGVVLIAVVIAGALDDTPLEEWAGNGPFCLKEGSNKFKYLQEDESLAYTVLASCLFSPRIEMRRLSHPAGENTQKGDIVVTVHLPNFVTDDVLDVHASMQQSTPKGRNAIMGPQQTLHHDHKVEIQDDDGYLKAVEFYYRDTSERRTVWRAKARIIKTPDGIILPDPPRRQETGKVIDPHGRIPEKPVRKNGESDADFKTRQTAYQTSLEVINEDIPGWVYAKLL